MWLEININQWSRTLFLLILSWFWGAWNLHPGSGNSNPSAKSKRLCSEGSEPIASTWRDFAHQMSSNWVKSLIVFILTMCYYHYDRLWLSLWLLTTISMISYILLCYSYIKTLGMHQNPQQKSRENQPSPMTAEFPHLTKEPLTLLRVWSMHGIHGSLRVTRNGMNMGWELVIKWGILTLILQIIPKMVGKPWKNHGKSCGEDARSTLTIN